MRLLRAPLVLVGLVLTLLGFGNVYTGRMKTAEYEQLLEVRSAAVEPPRRSGTSHLDPKLRSTLLSSLAGQQDPAASTRAKVDFYRVVHSGGRLLTLLGIFCAIGGAIHFWYREGRVHPAYSGGE